VIKESKPTPTDRELSLLHSALEWSEEDHKEALGTAIENFGPMPDLEKRFGPGTFGMFEVGDRAHIMIENWESYISSHPSLALYPDLHRIALIAQEFMMEVYQKTMTMDAEEEKCPTSSQ
jgi:hypothetical protein